MAEDDWPEIDFNKLSKGLYEFFKSEIHFEQERFYLDIIERVSTRLQSSVPDGERLKVVIPWMQEVIAFTAPGKYVYFSRRLLERCQRDEHVAFIVGHELAHHHLGHIKLFTGWMGKVMEVPGAMLVPLVFMVLEKRLYGPEKECDADRCGLELCASAGYDPEVCLEIFDILENYALDRGDLDIVYGPDVDSDDELSADSDWKTKTRIWWWQRTRGYLPIRDRKEMLRRWLSEKQ